MANLSARRSGAFEHGSTNTRDKRAVDVTQVVVGHRGTGTFIRAVSKVPAAKPPDVQTLVCASARKSHNVVQNTTM